MLGTVCYVLKLPFHGPRDNQHEQRDLNFKFADAAMFTPRAIDITSAPRCVFIFYMMGAERKRCSQTL
jgi:hypothetical protein